MGEHTTTRDATIESWTARLGEASGNPGGGAAAGVMLAIAAGLMSMVAGYSDDAGELRDRARVLRDAALDAAEADAAASAAFGAAFRRDDDGRKAAIREASLAAATSSAALGDRARAAIPDLEHLAAHGEPTLVADVAVAAAALRAALASARTNLSYDLATLRSAGHSLEEVRAAHPGLWTTVAALADAIARVDGLTARIDDRAAPTD
ncbi:cyclodeaminase/cyclohydrolase family protein [Microbacterium marinilacus]|uniref:Cyclodeaminase/cyclohydrolase domain-containing protein n=1 Tax=Microbacterium marinilacus TaxID=415209 RepID=A0ABP7B549_9MICO|nr:cyclodeaminase/cyclohydrolase family protein [Microbacterium marinilacus]